MTNNEIIARFDGATKFKTYDGVLCGYWPELDEGRGEGWLDVPCYADSYELWAWHGPGGLLEKIEERGVRGLFLRALGDDIMPERVFDNLSAEMQELVWRIRTATPAQLTAALVATIKEVSDGK